MRAFVCPRCGHLLFFENTACLRCGTELGYDPLVRELVNAADRQRCSNAAAVGCNWLVGEMRELCRSCRLTRNSPIEPDLETAAAVVDVEAAKRRLLFQLDELGLPVVERMGPAAPALAFDLYSSRFGPVTTGHQDGVITIDLAESDDAHREAMRCQLGEPYRTVLGHLRHEIGHYLWPTLVGGRPTALEGFREQFGDERADYGEALEHHYGAPAPTGWEASYVSAYATMHPWEDWSETFAHYLHILDALQTAAAFGLIVVGPAVVAGPVEEPALVSAPTPDLRQDDFKAIVDEWLPLIYALNAVNRSMGREDLYPFMLAPDVIAKLAFVHSLAKPLGEGPAFSWPGGSSGSDTPG